MQRLHKVVASCYVIIIFDFGKIARRVWGSDCIMNSTALATTIELSSMVLYSNKLINWPIGIGVGSLSKYIHHGILSRCSYICTCTVTCNSQVFPCMVDLSLKWCWLKVMTIYNYKCMTPKCVRLNESQKWLNFIIP